MATRYLMLSALVLGLGAGAAQAQGTFQGIAGEQTAEPETRPVLPNVSGEPRGLRFEIAPPTPAELSKLDREGPGINDPFFKSSIVTRHRIRNNGTTGLDIFDALFD